jgi:hypothetical protein
MSDVTEDELGYKWVEYNGQLIPYLDEEDLEKFKPDEPELH